MIEPRFLFKQLEDLNINFFSGVPDSLLKDFCAYITYNTTKENSIIAANEGNAIALAAGYYLATNKIGLVYMQNSGIGNSINPLLSLVDKDVYQIPMLLLIGWRGEPGRKDACQHKRQGKVTIDLLNSMKLEYDILPDTEKEASRLINKAYIYMKEKSLPYAIVVRQGTFTKYKYTSRSDCRFSLNREEAIDLVLSRLNDEIIISTTGKISREVYENREKNRDSHKKDFLMVGSMGHASQIALAISLFNKNRDVYCLDGDGALIMHMGGLTTVGGLKAKNYKHIIFNNGAHDSVGGQPTVGFNIDIRQIAKASGYNNTYLAENRDDLIENLGLLAQSDGPSLLEVRVNKGARKDLARPVLDALSRKKIFMDYLKSGAK